MGFENKKKTDPAPPPPKPAAQVDEHAHPDPHNPFGDWVPAIVGSLATSAASLSHYVDHDLHGLAPKPVDPKVAANAEQQGAAYAKQLVGMRDTTDDHKNHYQILNLLDRVDDPLVREKMKEQFAQTTGQSLEDFINKASWDGKRDKAEALALISPERARAEEKMAALPPAEREQLRKEGFASAGEILKIAGKDDAGDDGNARKMADALAGKSPEQIEAIRAAVRSVTNQQQGIYEHLDRTLSHGNEDEAVANLHGSGSIHATVVALNNAKDDPKRLREILERVKPEQRDELKFMGPALVGITAHMPEGDRKDIWARISGETGKANSDRITELLRDPGDAWTQDVFGKGGSGYNMSWDSMQGQKLATDAAKDREPKNIIHELERMSPEDLKEARTSYDPKQHGGKTWDDMVRDRFGKDIDGQRISALLSGDRVGDRALELREGMRKHDEHMIEHALKNEDLASKDPAAHARGVAEQQQLELRMRTLDALAGSRSIDQQLDSSYHSWVEGDAEQNPMAQMGKYMPGGYKEYEEREKKAADFKIATGELRSGGQLTLATEVHRAAKQEQADLLENATTSELAEATLDHKTKYKKDLIAAPDLDAWAFQAQNEQRGAWMRGEKAAPLADLERKAAYDDMDVNERRLEMVRTEGVKSKRTDDQLVADQNEIYAKQHSDSLDRAEQQREMFGGGIGSQHLWRESIDAMEAQNKKTWVDLFHVPGMPQKTNDVREIDRVATGEQETAREEKINLANREAMIINKMAELAAKAFPEAGTLIKAVGGLLAIADKKAVAGEAVNATKEIEELAIDTGVDLIGEYIGPAEEKAKDAAKGASSAVTKTAAELAKEAKEEAKKEAAKKVIGATITTAGGVAKGSLKEQWIAKEPGEETKSSHDIAIESLAEGFGELLPDFVKEAVGEKVGHGKAGSIIGGGAGKLTKKVLDTGVDHILDKKPEEEAGEGHESG